jgi:hypothetical protein
MYKIVVTMMALSVLRLLYADQLLDDFEHEGTKNLRNGVWYYFSDAKDEGNSKILNAENLPNGSYSAFEPVKEGADSGYCAKLDYVLGNVEPEVEAGSTNHCNFTALGTDIARQGGFVDIRPAYGVSFKARSRDSILIFVELVTSNIYDYAYYRAYFWVTKTWKTFSIDFNDSNQFRRPDYYTEVSSSIDYPLMLSKVQKINWQVPRCFQGFATRPLEVSKYCHCHSDTGSFFLDDIILLDSTTVAVKYQPAIVKKRVQSEYMSSDLLGRRLLLSESIKAATGKFVFTKSTNDFRHSIILMSNY